MHFWGFGWKETRCLPTFRDAGIYLHSVSMQGVGRPDAGSLLYPLPGKHGPFLI